MKQLFCYGRRCLFGALQGLRMYDIQKIVAAKGKMKPVAEDSGYNAAHDGHHEDCCIISGMLVFVNITVDHEHGLNFPMIGPLDQRQRIAISEARSPLGRISP